MDTLQEIFGYLLTSNTSQQKIFLIIGPPRSGKGTMVRITESASRAIKLCRSHRSLPNREFRSRIFD